VRMSSTTSSRRWHVARSWCWIAIIFDDRHQGALQLNPEEIRARNEAFAPPPDLLFLLHLPAAHAYRRVDNEAHSVTSRARLLERVPQSCWLDSLTSGA